jgi:hypothetical protein
MISHFDETIKGVLNDRLIKLEEHFEADVIFFYGEVHPVMEKLDKFMTLAEEVQKEIEERKEALKDNKEYVRLRDFYIEMQELGIAKKPEYDLPPLDTIGRDLYECRHSVSKKKMF